MKRIISPADMKKWEQSCFNNGITSIGLMERAASGLMKTVQSLRKARIITCVCGSGNNGGDGIALAWLLSKEHIPSRIILVNHETGLTAESSYYLELARQAGVTIQNDWLPSNDELIVDALFGIGLNRTVTGIYADYIRKMNDSGCTIVSADIPSGLDALTGAVLGNAVKADVTVTMQYIKSGMLLGKGPAHTGKIEICSLAEIALSSYSDEWLLQENEDIYPLLPTRPFDSHKGKNGHALLCVGSPKYIGAALLSSRSCLRTGCGILSVCIPDPVRPYFNILPEAITVPTGTDDWNLTACKTAADSFSGKDAIGIGCGIGSGDIRYLLTQALNSGLPLVIDADGLNALAVNRDLYSLLHNKVVLTPHPGEMSRLLNCRISDVLSDPLSAVRSFPCTVLLKGPVTLVSDGTKTVFCKEGSPALAKGGSGDVLTGMITALLAQGLSPFDAARAGTYLLGTSANKAMTVLNERMLLASDIIDLLEKELYG